MRIENDNGKVYFINDKKKVVAEYDECIRIDEIGSKRRTEYTTYYEVIKGENKGILACNEKLDKVKEVVPCIFYNINYPYSISSNTINVATHEKKVGVYDFDGKVIIPPEFDRVNKCDDIYVVGKDRKFGVKDIEGKDILPIEFDSIERDDDVYTVSKDEKVGVYNKNGKVILPIEFDSVEFNIWDGFTVEKDGKQGLYSYGGQLILPVEFDYLDLDTLTVSVPMMTVKHGKKVYNLKIKNFNEKNLLTKLVKRLAENEEDVELGEQEEKITIKTEVKDITEEKKDNIY